MSLVTLCACTRGAEPSAGTSGAAAFLARSRRAAVSFGFRAPADPAWALEWSERFFRRFGEGGYFDHLVADLRRREPDDTPGWAIPTVHARRRLSGDRSTVLPPRLTVTRFGQFKPSEPPGNIVHQALDLPELQPDEARSFLSRTAWDREQPPPDERPAVDRLCARLAGRPLPLHLAGATLRDGVSAQAYLDAQARVDPRADPVAVTLGQTFGDLDPHARWALQAMAVLPRGRGSDEQVAAILGWPAPFASVVIDGLIRRGLAERGINWTCELHEPLAGSMRAFLQGFPDLWNRLHQGIAESALALARWVSAPIGLGAERGPKRWIFEDEFFRRLDPSPWLAGAPGAEVLARAIATLDPSLEYDHQVTAREASLTMAEALCQKQGGATLAAVLAARAKVRLRRGAPGEAASDLREALSIFRSLGDTRGEAEVGESLRALESAHAPGR